MIGTANTYEIQSLIDNAVAPGIVASLYAAIMNDRDSAAHYKKLVLQKDLLKQWYRDSAH